MWGKIKLDLYPTQKSILGSGGKVKNLNVGEKTPKTKKPLKPSVENIGEYIYDVGKIYKN